jgi:hypothetical protein
MLPLEAKLTLVTIYPTIVTMKAYGLRLRLGMGLLTWFLSTRLLTLFRAHKLHRFLEIFYWEREYGRIWGCVKFVFRSVGLRSIGILAEGFWWSWESPIFSTPSPLHSSTVRHGYPWVPTDQAHGRPRQVGKAVDTFYLCFYPSH